jgi:hypothetical protein
MKKLLSIFLILSLLISVMPAATAEAATKLNKTKITIDSGDTYQLKLSGTSAKVKWTSSDKKVATVSSKGIVKGVSEGKATITATANKKSYKATVTVKDTYVKLIYTAYLTEDTTIDDYIKELASTDNRYKYEKYDEDHYICYMKKSEYNSQKDDVVKLVNDAFDNLKYDEKLTGIVKSVEYDDKYQEIKLLVDSAKCDFAVALYVYLQAGMMSDLGQTIILIKPEDRIVDIKIIDYKTGKEIEIG